MGYEEDTNWHRVGPLLIGDAAEAAEGDKLVPVILYGLTFHRQLDLD